MIRDIRNRCDEGLLYFWNLFNLKFINILLQASVETQLWQPAVDPGSHCSLQRADSTVSCVTEAGTDVHGHQHQHGKGLPTEGLRATSTLPERPQPSKAWQVGHVTTHCFPAAGLFFSYLHCRTQNQIPTRIWLLNLMATLYYAEHVHVTQPRIQIPIQSSDPHFWDGYPYPDWDPSPCPAM